MGERGEADFRQSGKDSALFYQNTPGTSSLTVSSSLTPGGQQKPRRQACVSTSRATAFLIILPSVAKGNNVSHASRLLLCLLLSCCLCSRGLSITSTNPHLCGTAPKVLVSSPLKLCLVALARFSWVSLRARGGLRYPPMSKPATIFCCPHHYLSINHDNKDKGTGHSLNLPNHAHDGSGRGWLPRRVVSRLGDQHNGANAHVARLLLISPLQHPHPTLTHSYPHTYLSHRHPSSLSRACCGEFGGGQRAGRQGRGTRWKKGEGDREEAIPDVARHPHDKA